MFGFQLFPWLFSFTLVTLFENSDAYPIRWASMYMWPHRPRVYRRENS
jgi:hypothetical protein